MPRTLNVRFLQWEMLILDGPQDGFSIAEKTRVLRMEFSTMENVRGPQESICFNLSRGFQLHINKESEACRFIGIPHALYSPWLGSYQK